MIQSRCGTCRHPAGKHQPLDDRGQLRGACQRSGCDCVQYRVPQIKQDGDCYPERRDPKYTAWIRTLPCVVAGHLWAGVLPGGQRTRFFHECWGPIDPMHIKTRATGAPDLGAVLPGCRRAHDWQPVCGGIKEWAAGYGWSVTDLEKMAQALVPVWEKDVLGVQTL